MSDVESNPQETFCDPRNSPLPTLLEARDVPLGGARGMMVRRTLPHKQIRTVGAWCFVDHFGPAKHRMNVPPHPHMGLQTVSWLLDGEVEHRDSLGSHQLVRPGQTNVMTAGHGIAHSEYAVSDPQVDMHGLQLWVALTDEHRDREPSFEHHADLPQAVDGGATTTVILGEFAGLRSPASAFSPIAGAQVQFTGSTVLPLDPDFEYAVLAFDSAVEMNGYRVPHTAMQYVGWGNSQLHLSAEAPTRVLVLGGEPMTESLLMWWNFVGRDHDEIVAAREQWESGDPRFGQVHGDPAARLPAPPMPGVALKPRPPRP